MPRSKTDSRSSCPIGCSLDIVGDRWTLLVVRDLLMGKSRYGEIADSPEKIPTNILADRLQRLEESGLIEGKPYQTNPPRYAYTLTRKGRELAPVLGALAKWSMQHIAGVKPDEKLHRLLRSA